TAVVRVPAGMVRRRLRLRLGARRAAHVHAARRRGELRREERAMKRLRLLVGTEMPVVGILAFALLPWLWMVLSSFRPDAEITESPIRIIPGALTLVNHIEL